MKVGATALTVIPRGAHSTASALVRPLTACLLAQYAARPGVADGAHLRGDVHDPPLAAALEQRASDRATDKEGTAEVRGEHEVEVPRPHSPASFATSQLVATASSTFPSVRVRALGPVERELRGFSFVCHGRGFTKRVSVRTATVPQTLRCVKREPSCRARPFVMTPRKGLPSRVAVLGAKSIGRGGMGRGNEDLPALERARALRGADVPTQGLSCQ